jgi:capsular exopolysaccharide synthesis family protein
MLGQPGSSFSESIRLLRTNIEFASATQALRTLVISSPNPGEGKSTITANLAVAMAQSGLNVVVVDADLRSPSQHSLFNVYNERGLSTLLTHQHLIWKSVAVPIVGIPGLSLIPSGPLPPNPADILSLDRLQACLNQISDETDIVLMDVPPVLPVSDSLIVSAHADGVVLVCRAEQTKRAALRTTAAALRQGSAMIIGVVLNQQVRGVDTYGYGSSAYGQSPERSSSLKTPADHSAA